MAIRGVDYVNIGVSGGYQAAREGPSLSLGGDDKTLDAITPLFKIV